MIENFIISISFSEVEEAYVGNYFRLSEMSGEFLIIQKPDIPSTSFVPMIVTSWASANPLIGILYQKTLLMTARVQDETTLILWCDILRFTFESDFVRQFFPYNTHFKGKMRIDGALCFYIHDYYPTRCKDISVFDRKMSNLVFRFKEGRQAAFVAKIFSFVSPGCRSLKRKPPTPC